MSHLFGKPHFEIVAHYGFREVLLGRRATRGEAEALRHDYAGMEEYKHIIIRQVEL
jgi:hypothetical protein